MSRGAFLLVGLAPLLLGCSSGGAPRDPSPSAEVAVADQPSAPGASVAPRGPGVRVVWEALAAERELAETSRFRRPGTLVNQRIELVNEGHPDAVAAKSGRTAATRGDTTIAVVSDQDMRLLVQGFQQAGFFQYAKPTGSMEALFDRSDARGRITLERDDGSLTLLSLRGQGTQPATKRIPAIYSDLKQAIAMIRNRTPTLNVRMAGASGRVDAGR